MVQPQQRNPYFADIDKSVMDALRRATGMKSPASRPSARDALRSPQQPAGLMGPPRPKAMRRAASAAQREFGRQRKSPMSVLDFARVSLENQGVTAPSLPSLPSLPVDGFGDPRAPGAPLRGATYNPRTPFGPMAPLDAPAPAPAPAGGLIGTAARTTQPVLALRNPPDQLSTDDVATASAIRNETRGIDNLRRRLRSVAKTEASRAQAAELLQGRGRGGNADLYDSSDPFNMGNAAVPRSPGVNEDFQASRSRKEGRVGMSTNRQRAAQMPGGMPDLPAGFQYADQQERASQPRAAANMQMGSKPYDPVRSESIGESVPSDIRASLEAGQPLNSNQRARLRALGAERRERLRSNKSYQDYRDRLRERREDALDLRREANALRGGQRQTGALTYVDRGTGLTGTQRRFSGPSMSLAEAAGRVRQRREDQRRQDEADEMAQGQQRFNQRLQAIQSMGEGPAKDIALNELRLSLEEPAEIDGKVQSLMEIQQREAQDEGFKVAQETGQMDSMVRNILDGLPGSDMTRQEYMEAMEIRPDMLVEYERNSSLPYEERLKILDIAEEAGIDVSERRRQLTEGNRPTDGFVPQSPANTGMPPSFPVFS